MAEENVNDASTDVEAPTENEETVVDESPSEPVEEVVQETAEEAVAATADTEDVPAEPADEPEAVEEVAAEAAAEEPEAAEEVAAEPAEEPEAAEEAASEPAEDATAGVSPPAAADTPEVAAAEPKRKRKRVPRALRPVRTRRTRVQSEERKPIVRLPKPEAARGRRQERQGVVVSDAMEKTIVVKVDTIKAHRRYGKVLRRSAKFHAHDEGNEAKVGDIVRIVETRPLSATKRWRLAEIVEAAK